jgi:predicted component of type VI protein secretion system
MPGSLSRAQRFDLESSIAAARLLVLNPQLEGVDVVVEDVPRMPARASRVSLGRVHRQTTRPQFVLHRKAIESRAEDRDEVIALVRDVLAELAGDYLGSPADEVDPEYPRTG